MPPRRRSAGSQRSLIWLVPLIVLVTAAGTAGTLWATGYFDEEQPEAVSRKGQIAFPALVRPVRAYETLTRDDLLNPQTGELNVIWLPEDMVNENMLRDLAKIIGRVVANNKSPGFILTERDFMPMGTRPGITAGIPEGKRSLSVAVERVPGMELLRQGDRFDLLAVLPERKQAESSVELAALLGGIKQPDTRSGQLARQTGIKPLVLGGMMVAITQGKLQSTAGAQELTVPPAGSRNANRTPAMVATIAVDPVEVTPLTEALGLDVELYCVARSGHPSEKAETEKTAELEGLVPVVTTARSVSAYSSLSPEDLADSVTGRLQLYYFPPERIGPDWLTAYEDLQGRVPRRDLPVGSVIREADLMPPGTRPGLAAAMGAGENLFTVPVATLQGVERLSPGDRFSVLMLLADEKRPSFPLTDWASLQGGLPSPADAQLEHELRQGVRVVVQQATLLRRESSNSGQVSIALSREELLALTQVLQSGEPLYVAGESEGAPAPAQKRPTSPGPFDVPEVRWPQEKNRSEPVHGSGVTRVASLQDAERRAEPRRAGEAFPVKPVAAEQNEPGEQRPGVDTVKIPVTARNIEAFTRIRAEHFVDPATGRVRYLYFPRERVRADWVRDLDDLLDRVVTRSIEAGRTVREGDLAAPGAQAGPSTGIPEGWLGLHVTGAEVQGLDEATRLEPGDRFEMRVADVTDWNQLGGALRRGLSGGDALSQARANGQSSRAESRALARGVILVEIGRPTTRVRERLTNQTETTVQTILTPEGPMRTETTREEPHVHQATIETRSYLLALRPDEAARFAEALANNQRIQAVPESGRQRPTAENPEQLLDVAENSPGDSLSEHSTRVEDENEDASPQKSGLRAGQPVIIEHIRGQEVTREVWTTPRLSGQ